MSDARTGAAASAGIDAWNKAEPDHPVHVSYVASHVDSITVALAAADAHDAEHGIRRITDDELQRLIVEAQAQAWDEGVATALNHAILNEDGITLRLEHLDGRTWENPYRTAGLGPEGGEQ